MSSFLVGLKFVLLWKAPKKEIVHWFLASAFLRWSWRLAQVVAQIEIWGYLICNLIALANGDLVLRMGWSWRVVWCCWCVCCFFLNEGAFTWDPYVFPYFFTMIDGGPVLEEEKRCWKKTKREPNRGNALKSAPAKWVSISEWVNHSLLWVEASVVKQKQSKKKRKHPNIRPKLKFRSDGNRTTIQPKKNDRTCTEVHGKAHLEL